MVRCLSSHRFVAFDRRLFSLFRLRNVALISAVTVVVWFCPPPDYEGLIRYRSSLLDRITSEKQTRTNWTTSSTTPTSSSPSSADRSASALLSPSATPVTPSIPSTIGNSSPGATYLSQKPPMPGTGLGNLMFMYASLLGIANHANMTPVYPSDGPLRQFFDITVGSLSPMHAISTREFKACTFDARLFDFVSHHRNTTVQGYFQSWKYFGAISERVRREFRFNESLRMEADGFLRKVFQTSVRGNGSTSPKNVVFVGVHIRRCDMLFNYNIARGYTVATQQYLVSAVEYFRFKLPEKNLVYVVCGDDQSWSRKNFPPPLDNSSFVGFSENRTAIQDMAILAACNHSIMTVGTYGWWSAYLAGGTTVYYKDFPTPGSQIDEVLNKIDYFPPNWIGM